jgi:hypothetical protein
MSAVEAPLDWGCPSGQLFLNIDMGVHGFDFGRSKREKRAVVSGVHVKEPEPNTNAEPQLAFAA